MSPKTGTNVDQKPSHGSRIFYAVAGTAVTPLISLATAPILAQTLGVEGRGTLAAGMAPMLFAVAVGALGMPEALTFYVARQARGARRAVRRAFGILTLLGAVAAALVALSAPILADGNTEVEQLIMLTAILTIPTFWASIPNSILAGTHAWKRSALMDFALSALRLILLSALAMSGLLVPLTATVVMLGIPLLKGLLTVPYLIEYRRGYRNATAKRVRLFSYGSRLWVGSLAGVVLLRLDQLLMIPLAGPAQLGLYAVAVSLGEVPAVLAGAVRNVVFSSDAGSSQDREHTDRLQQTARLTSAAAGLASIGIGVLLPWAIPVLFGASFGAAVAVTWVILAGVTLGTAGSVAGAGLSARGRPGLRSWGMVIGAIANTAVLLMAVPTLGAMGAALSTLVGNVVAGTMNVVWLRAHFGMGIRGFYGLRSRDIQLVLKTLVRQTGKKKVHAFSN
ncbi:lipopolysaccharide biosynthesis protein [Paenarthrobacter aurescens]|jgi:O-antigen/teichoic acid export membrane protein|uniref:Integral membrane protein n=1 Tax=Paenarthrobacter aurescens (strain TC1) TaxID=290340 RepID=A1RC23_PAEAT|nr:oligosaccharide flippase family protein [Paenarthrobacter aurescens]ABM09332.1 putative integral membrane protein [Paenarthrobacter aurescens TC1]